MNVTKVLWYVIFIGSILLVTGPSTCYAARYYVSISGSDGNPGTRSLPWRTIQKAADTMSAGDSCLISAGEYDEKLSIVTSGSPDNLISYIAAEDTVKTKAFYITADYIRVQGFMLQADECNSTWGYGVKLAGDHSIIEENYVYYCPRGGIQLTPKADHNMVRHNDCNRNGLIGISVDGTYNVCEYNEIWGSIVEHTPTGCLNEDCDGIRFFGTGHTFRGNYIHDINYSGDNEGHSPHIDGFQTYWWSGVQDSAQDCTFEYNFIDLPYYKEDGASAKGWELEDARDLTIRNNVVRGAWGIRCEARNVKIINNTLLGDSTMTAGWQVGIRLHDAAGCSVYNNIIVDFDDMAVETTGTNGGSALDYNCTYMRDESRPGGDAGLHDLWGIDPLLANMDRNEFHLLSGSPCRDAGIDLGEPFDDGLHPEMEWTDKVVTVDQDEYGSGWEMGAYIYILAVPDRAPPAPPRNVRIRERLPP